MLSSFFAMDPLLLGFDAMKYLYVCFVYASSCKLTEALKQKLQQQTVNSGNSFDQCDREKEKAEEKRGILGKNGS